MAIQFACPKCGRQLRVPDSAVGREAQCPKCENLAEVSELYAKVPDVDPAPNPFAAPANIKYDEPPNPYAAVVDKNARNWAMAGHLLGLTGAVFPFGNILGPMVVWLIKKDESPFAADQAKESLNFQITMMLSGFLLALIGIVTCGVGFVLIPVVLVAGIVLPIIAGIKANDGIPYRYPCTMRLVR